jgi:Zn-dependent peptidase ImmA (M78 family)/predicted secreted protein
LSEVNKAQLDAHRRTGSLRAQRALTHFDVDYEAPVNVFAAIEREQVWLMFQPLDRLYGAYRRRDTPGIVLHAGHPGRLQRFTAAHELGHHLLGHEISVDSREEVEQAFLGSLPAQEIEAQAFAATFLMPVQLVNRALSHLGLSRRPGDIEPQHAYRISLELGSSYTATVTQLRALERISATNAKSLLGVQPIDIKTQLALGERPANARADVWPVSVDDNGRELWVGLDDEVHALLTETPTTGYRWRPDADSDAVQIAGDEPIRDRMDSGYGTERERHLWWRALAPADTAIAAGLRRSFQEANTPQERFEICLHVAAPLTGESGRGVSRRQLQLL